MMDNASRTLLVPLTLPGPAILPRGESEKLDAGDLIEISCSNSRVTSLVSWGWAGPEPAETRGVVLGCEDGTLYVFQPLFGARVSPQGSSHSHSNSLVETDLLSAPPTPSHNARRHSRSTYSSSRSASPSYAFHQATFNVTSRSHAVSGLSKEQAEAPKNYVDFDDEPEKLKEILKSKGLRDKTMTDNLVPNFDRGLVIEKSPPPSPSLKPRLVSKRKDDARSLLSATNSPPITPKSLSTPTSPKLTPVDSKESSSPYDLSLRYHIIPDGAGSMSALHLLSDSRLLIVLKSSGALSVIKTRDGTCLASSQASKVDLRSANSKTNPDGAENMWTWKHICALDAEETTLLLVSAALDRSVTPSSEEADTQERTRAVLFEIFAGDEQGSYECKIDVLGQWYIDGSAEGLGLHRESDNTVLLSFIDARGHLITQSLRILPRIAPPPNPEVLNPESSSHNIANLPLPNPFKGLKHKSSDNVSVVPTLVDAGRVILDEEVDICDLLIGETFVSSRMRSVKGSFRGAVWTDQQLVTFEHKDKTSRILFKMPTTGIRDLTWVDEDHYVIDHGDRAESYVLETVDARNDLVIDTNTQIAEIFQSRLIHTLSIDQHQALEAISSSSVLVTTFDKADRRAIRMVTSALDSALGRKSQSRKLWMSPRNFDLNSASKVHLTSILPLGLDSIIFGHDDGLIRRSSFPTSIGRGGAIFTAVSDTPLNGSITCLRLVKNERTQEQFIVGGSNDGSIAFWSLHSLELRARWTIFTSPLDHVTQFIGENEGPLRGCVLCISEDGTVAVIVIDGLQFLHLVPGSVSSLQRVCVGGHNMLLVYSDGLVRLWDIQTTEFWRSTSVDKAEELISQGGWTELSLTDSGDSSNNVVNILPSSYRGLDAASTLLVDLEILLSEALTVLKAIHDKEKIAITSIANQLRSVLSTLFTPGLSEDIDSLCREKLGIHLSSVLAGAASIGTTTLFNTHNAHDIWCVSPELSAARALLITTVLRMLGLVDDLTGDCNTVATFYATSLSQVIGVAHQPPSLAFLARHWFQSSNELRQAARTLFDAGISRLSDEETIILAEQWQHDLPCLQPDTEKELMPAAMSLFLCGYMAAEKYSLLSTSGLTDISKSIAIYLHDEKSIHRVLAIDLCSRGFHIWQHYVDAMEMLRALFTLATSSRKEAISPQNVGPQARLAVLQIAASNTPLFMTTLGLDILHPRSVEHRKSTMQLVAFLIRKRPLVLYPNLPRLMEAVVKSLDPNSTASRDAVLDTATEILGHVVKTFPTVDFYMPSQRLAVGTSEGAIVMYDLKTATRLYVLEGHKKRIAACSFSPDGRRLVSVSLEEGAVLVWKVGSSFASFFNPGAPPRQGGGKGEGPFRTLGFNVGDEADMTVGASLEWVRFEWTAERSVKLKIRESTLTFST